MTQIFDLVQKFNYFCPKYEIIVSLPVEINHTIHYDQEFFKVKMFPACKVTE